jgi:zinc protease
MKLSSGARIGLALLMTFLAAATVRAQQPPATQTAGGNAQEQYRIVNQPDEIVSVLNNGATVIAKRVPSPAVSVRGYVKTGGIHEGRWLGGGLSHLLEHLVAGGSTAERTEAENREILQAIGNVSNAYTSSDHTAYFINTTPEHLDQAVDLLTGWLFGALITPEEYQREYQVVQRELEKGKGEPQRQFHNLLMANRYHVHPARVPVIGYQQVIQGLSRDDVYEYYRLTYQPNNVVFSIAGDVAPELMLQAVQREVDNVPAGRLFTPELPDEPPVLTPRTVVASFPKLGQAMVNLAFPTIRLQHPDLYAMDLLAGVLGDGESSLLVEEIRDKLQLVSDISASHPTPEYVEGSFEIEMQVDPERIHEATAAVLELLDQVKSQGVEVDRLDRARAQMRAARIKGQQTAEQIASSLAGDFLSSGDIHFTDRYLQGIAQVTPEQIQQVAARYFDRGRLLTTVMLPAEAVGAAGLPRAEDLVRASAPATAPAHAAADGELTRAELPNGTILLHKRISTAPLVSIQMYALGGVVSEDEATNGLGNLAMQTAPRGTATRNAEQIARFLDSIGADLQTQCGNNSFVWTSTCLKEDAARVMEVYADVVNNSAFPPDEIDAMKQRVLAGIERQDSDWLEQAMRLFRQSYFGPPRNLPYRFRAIGTAENVTRFTPEDVRAWYRDRVLPSRRVLAIFGDIELDQARALAEQHLGQGARLPMDLPAGEAPAPAAPAEPGDPSITIERVELTKTEHPVAGVVIGFDSGSVIGDASNDPIGVGDTMASGFGYPTGYLHEILRGRGLVYMVHAYNWPGRSRNLPGAFIAYAGCDPRKVNEVIDLMLENVARLQGTDADMDASWFERSKRLVITSDALDQETAAEQASTAALDELYGLGVDFHAGFADRVRAVKLEDVRHVAAQRLRRCVVTVSTPAPELVKIAAGERTYKTFPPVDLTPRGVQHDAQGQ